MLSGIAAMDMGGHKLEGTSICSDGMFEGSAGFIVQDMDHGCAGDKGLAGMDVFVGGDAGSTCLLENDSTRWHWYQHVMQS